MSFINVDLDIASTEDLAPIVAALSPDAYVLSADAKMTTFELAIDPTDAESALRAFVRLIESFPPPARKLWTSASKRDLSIGMESGADSFELALTPAIMAMVSRLDARIVVVVYPPEGPDAPPATDPWAGAS